MKIGICGYYGIGKDFQGGQPVKTQYLYDELVKMFGIKHVDIVSTSNWKKNPLRLILRTIILHYKSDNLIIIPAKNGIRVLGPLFSIYNFYYKKKLHYVVVGGWLHSLIDNNLWLLPFLKKYSGIYVETNTMKVKLEDMGLSNVFILRNFKQLKTVDISLYRKVKIFNFCTFTRVIKEKGIEEAVKVIIRLNEEGYKCTLDIYGPIYDEYIVRFMNLIENSPSYIKYKGLVKPENSTEVLKKYFIQLFPTRFYTEGVPGSIIDSYYAGVPVIASKWESFHDVIDEFETGLGFKFNDTDDFYEKVIWAIRNEDKVYSMKLKCIEKSKDYNSENIIKIFIQNL